MDKNYGMPYFPIWPENQNATFGNVKSSDPFQTLYEL